MNPFAPELGKAPIAPPKPRTGVLTREIVHNTRDDDRELESRRQWGYYALTGELSKNINPDSAPCKPYYVRFYPFVCVRTLDRGDGHFDFHYRACAVLAYTSAEDCEVGDFYEKFECTRQHTLVIPVIGGKFMRFEKKVYRIPHLPTEDNPYEYDEIELWERVS